jgi:type VI secretion system protein ImpE
MTATDAFKAGRLKEATDLQLAAVKADPADHGKRVFLFELAAFAGDWDRARRQIDAVKYDDPALAHATDQYRGLIEAKVARQKLFSDGVQPSFLATPPEHVAYRLDALKKLREGDPAAAAELVAKANEMAPPLAGTLNDAPFADLRDADDLFAGVLEVMAHGKYFWLPLEQVESVAANPPRFPRDTVWFPVKLATKVNESGDVFLPALYPGSGGHADDAVRLGRATDWSEPAPGFARGAGLRTVFAGEHEVGLLEWRELLVTPAAGAGAS